MRDRKHHSRGTADLGTTEIADGRPGGATHAFTKSATPDPGLTLF